MAGLKKAENLTTDDLKDQLDTLKGDIADLANLVGKMGGAQAERAQEAIEEKLNTAREAGATHAQEARVQAQKLGAEANDFILRQPATALGIAAGVGFLIGMLGSRR